MLFQKNNINNNILVVPQEQGGVEDDNYFGSIGDATNNHVSNMTHRVVSCNASGDRIIHVSNGDRQLWQELYTTRNGLIFHIIPNPGYNDVDPMGLSSADLEKYSKSLNELKNKGLINSSTKAAMLEAAEVEQERRNASEDVMDHSELVAFDQWEKFPQMSNHIEMPKTPNDIVVYAGECNQVFYDEFPEGHPDAKSINSFLNMINRDWTELSDSYLDWIKKWLVQQKNLKKINSQYIIRIFSLVINQLKGNSGNPEEWIRQALIEIDDEWRKEYRTKSFLKLKNDNMMNLLIRKKNEWKLEAKAGKPVYGAIRMFGSVLFKDFRDSMKGSHWAMYRRTRDAFAPRIDINGEDINRCNISNIQWALAVNRKTAEKVWFNRPFSNETELRNKGFLKVEVFKNSEQQNKILIYLDKIAKEAKETSNLKKFSGMSPILVDWQKNNKIQLSYTEWTGIWSYYRLLRNELIKNLNPKERKYKTREDIINEFLRKQGANNEKRLIA